jgi:hypothetical protein
MAIGRVGSFATVEPALVDFGSMAERNIDKIKADEAAKKAAKAKGVSDRTKDLALPKPLDITTLNSADLKYGEMAQGLFNDMTYSKMLYEQTGSPEAKQNFETLNYAYGQLTSNVASLKENIPKFNDPAFLKGKNLSIAQERAEYFQKLDEEGRMRVDGKNILVKKPDGGEFRLESFIPSMMNIPDDFDYQGFVKNVRDNTGPSTTSGGSYMLNWTKESILDPASSRQRDFIKNAVATQAYENESALVDYAKKKGLKNEYGLTKTSSFTDDEKKEWIDQTYQDIINSFPSKEDKKYGTPDRSGSGGAKDKLKPTINIPSEQFDYAPGRGISYSGNPSDSPVLGSMTVKKTLSDGTKKNVQVNNAILKNIFIDKNGNVKMFYDELVGTENVREVNEKIGSLEALLSTTEIQSEKNDINNQIKTLKSQSSKTKKTSEVTIMRSDQKELGMIANAMNFNSTDELLSRLDELGGRKNNLEGNNKKVNLNASSRIKK